MVFCATWSVIGVNLILYSYLWFQADKNVILSWYKLHEILYFFSLSLLYHLFIETARSERKKLFIPLFYLPALILSVVTFFRPVLFDDFLWHGSCWVNVFDFVNPWFIFSNAAYFTVFPVITYIELSKLLKCNPSRKNRSLVRSLGGVYFFVVIVAYAVDFAVKPFVKTDYPHLGVIMSAFVMLVFYYNILRFDFISFDIRDFSDEITEHTSNILFVANGKGTILFSNKRFGDVFRDKPVSIDGIFCDYSELKKSMESIRKGELKRFSMFTKINSSDGEILTDLCVSGINDRFGDFTGFLLSARKISEAADFQKEYSISDSELEMVRLLAKGESMENLAEKYGLSRRTIESRVSGIYVKLEIHSRTELIKFGRAYNIL